MGQTIDGFTKARSPYQDTDRFGMGYGPLDVNGNPIGPWNTYGATFADLVTYLLTKSGTGLITYVGDINVNMKASDFELVSQAALSTGRTWTLTQANSVAPGQRRRIVDLAGVIGQFPIAVAPAGSDLIDGSNLAVQLNKRFSYLVVESDGVRNWTIVEQGPALIAGNNLGDLSSPSAARSNLGLGSAATQNNSSFVQPVNNLSDLFSGAAARANLGLGALSILNSLAYGNIDPSAIANLQQLLNATGQKLIPTDVLWNSRAPVNIPWLATQTWDFNQFINAIYLVGNAASSVNAINIKPGQSGFIIIKQAPGNTVARGLSFPSSFDWLTATAFTLYPAINTSNLVEYWAETSGLVHARGTQNI